MISHTTERFRKAYSNLPENVQERAKEAFKTFLQNPSHPSLRFKKIHSTQPIYSARVGLGYRALGIREKNEMIWFWIGSHAEYDKLLSQM